MQKLIAGKKISKWIDEYPILNDIKNYNEVCWFNPGYNKKLNNDQKKLTTNISEAEKRLKRFAPYIKEVFPETKNGIIESPLRKTETMKKFIEDYFSQSIDGDIYLKCDNKLPVAGSIKARGGIYEVLKHAEKMASRHKLLSKKDSYLKLAESKFKEFFSQFTIAVGSTGNLGLSIGIIGAKLGYNVDVHMSAEAKSWKKELLRKKGVNVIEYSSDYSKAVKEGRKKSEIQSRSYFIDDENSIDLFMGYAVAARRLKKQLVQREIKINKNNPLFVYLPCGVGGGPGGITFGLKSIYKENVHCFFIEPTHAPSMLLGLLTGKHNKISVQDFGIDNKTDADGLAVGKPSALIGKKFANLITGIFTVSDKDLKVFLRGLKDSEEIFMEPSAQAGFIGPVKLDKLKRERFIGDNNIKTITHIIWGTGGSMVPIKEKEIYYSYS